MNCILSENMSYKYETTILISQPDRDPMAMVPKNYILTDQDITIILNFHESLNSQISKRRIRTMSQISGSISMAVR